MYFFSHENGSHYLYDIAFKEEGNLIWSRQSADLVFSGFTVCTTRKATSSTRLQPQPGTTSTTKTTVSLNNNDSKYKLV